MARRWLPLLLPLLLLCLLAPAVLSVGFGVWNPAGSWVQTVVLSLLVLLSDLVEGVRLTQAPRLGPAVVLAFTVALLATAGRWEPRLPRPLRSAVALAESALAVLGMVAALGVFAVGVAVDRPTFWCGAVLVGLGAGQFRGEAPGMGSGQLLGWTAPEGAYRRTLGGGLAMAALLLAGITQHEGPGIHSPAFEFAALWLAGPGRSPWTSGGVWLLPGLFVVAWALRSGSGGRGPIATDLARVAVVIAAVVAAAVGSPDGGTAVAMALSAAGLLLVAAFAGPLVVGRLLPGTGGRLTDPRFLFAALLPLLLWSGLCAARGLSCQMWTRPGELPAGVVRVADREGGVFSLYVDPHSGALLFTDRDRTGLGILSTDGDLRDIDLRAHGIDAVEELGGRLGDTVWISAGDWEPTPSSGLLPVDLVGGPGDLVRLPECWVAAWVPLPEAARQAAGAREGDVLVGCEGSARAPLFRSSTGQLVGGLELEADLEHAVFHPDGDRFYAVTLWDDPRVLAYAWPDGALRDERLIGPFSWTLAFDESGDRLWTGRFFEGMALALDPEDLRPRVRVPLSFGVRAMLFEPVQRRLWAIAAYTGRVWVIEADPPYRRRALALCGQGRSLAADSAGRVYAATDCGIYRVDPRELGAW